MMREAAGALGTGLAAFGLHQQQQWVAEERRWRREDLDWRDKELLFMRDEHSFMSEEREYIHQQLQQANLDNARTLWLRSVERNSRDVMEKTEQLKAVSGLAALIAGFALISFLEFNLPVGAPASLLPYFATTTAVTVGVEMCSVVLCSLMLAGILRTGKVFVSEAEEAIFMHRCQQFCTPYRIGMRPAAPERTFAAYWDQQCAGSWKLAFCLFNVGVPFFFLNLLLAGWLQFHATVSAAVVVTVLMVAAMGCSVGLQLRWAKYLLKGEDPQGAVRFELKAVGLPFDWHMPGDPGRR